MNFPLQEFPISTEHILIGSTDVLIPKIAPRFRKWMGETVKNTFGNKALVDVNGQPLFAELAILELFTRNGWDGRWIETYGKSAMSPALLTNWTDRPYKEQIHQPIKDSFIIQMLERIASANNNSYSGCWDVLGWKSQQFIFAESKRKSKDVIRNTQIEWLRAALNCGLDRSNFLFVEWDFK